jgi:tetratricopeptide (TPR) repeat protein
MRIERNRLSFRRNRRRRAGCLSWAAFVGVLVGIGALTLNWLGGHMVPPAASGSTTSLVDAAEAAFLRGDLSGAINLARQALAAQPNEERALVLLARALIYRSYSEYDRAVDRQSAVELTTEALQHSPNSLPIMAIHAYALQADGQPVEAAKVAERALARDPNNTLARAAMALAYGGVGSHEVALRESMQAAKGTDWQMEAQRALAISYSDLGDYNSAIKAVEKAIALNTRLVPLYFERALYAMQLGDADGATAAYFQVLAFDPENVKARMRLCELSSLLRERDKAINYCQQVTTRAPAWPDGWYQLGLEYFLQGDFKQAQDSLHRCSSLQVMQNVPVSQRRFQCWYLQGQAAEVLGDCPSLLATYNEFRSMAADASVQQTWTYPPEGPPGCAAAFTPDAAPG